MNDAQTLRIDSYSRFDSLMKAKGVSAYRVAKDLDITQSTLSDWKSGRSMPKTDKLSKIAEYFGVTIEYFVT